MFKRLSAIAALACILLFTVWKLRRPASTPDAIAPNQPRPVIKRHAPVISGARPISRVPVPVHPKINATENAPVIHKPTSITHTVIPLVVSPPSAPISRPVAQPPAFTPPPVILREWKGNSDTSITRSGQIVVRTDEQWIHFWSEHHPDEAAPDVDFSRDMVVGVFLGLRPADSFYVTITGVRTLADKVIVDYLQTDPPPGTFQVAVSAYPYHLKVIPRTNLKITFNQLTAQYQRPAVSTSSSR